MKTPAVLITKNFWAWIEYKDAPILIEDWTLKVKVIDDHKGYWAEDELTPPQVRVLEWRLQKPDEQNLVSNNLLIYLGGGVKVRITDYKRNYWAETNLSGSRFNHGWIGELVRFFISHDRQLCFPSGPATLYKSSTKEAPT